jgi:hypothetical protein
MIVMKDKKMKSGIPIADCAPQRGEQVTWYDYGIDDYVGGEFVTHDGPHRVIVRYSHGGGLISVSKDTVRVHRSALVGPKKASMAPTHYPSQRRND